MSMPPGAWPGAGGIPTSAWNAFTTGVSGWRPGYVPTGPRRSFTGAVGGGSRSNLGNLWRLHLRGVQLDVVRRNREAARVAYRAAIEYTNRAGLIATGSYLRGWEVYDNSTGATVRNQEPHATVIETGRAPGTYAPPLRIQAWLVAKASNPDTMFTPEESVITGSGRAGAGPRGGTTGDLTMYDVFRRRAYLVNRVIYMHGLPAHEVMGRSAEVGRHRYLHLLIRTLIYHNAQRGDQAANIVFTDYQNQTRPMMELPPDLLDTFAEHGNAVMQEMELGIFPGGGAAQGPPPADGPGMAY